nr:aldehyde dehydrogenase family protein [Saprospiraceae bacterium]
MINLLNNKKLLKYGSYINGEWIVDGNYFDVINPYNGETLAQMSGCNPQIINKSIESADQAMSTWKTLTARERNEYLIAWYKKIIENKEDLSIILTLEQGKPIKESRAEISYGAEYIKWFAEEAKRIYGDVIPASVSGKKILVTKEPIGVVAAITPWNFPNAMITRKVSAAMAAGCSVLVKPSELTPLSALSLAELAHEAGIPEGVFNVIITDKPQEFANEVIASKIVKKLSFTGSTRVGKLLMTQCGHEIKRLSLELGGNAPFIVFEDADLENAADQCVASKFRNTGQTCVCTNRIFVHKSIYNLFLELLQDRLNSLKIGNGLDENTDIGPLINSA